MNDELKNNLKPINEIEMSEFVDGYLREQEEKRWKRDDKHSKFLDFLIEFVAKNIVVFSDDFYYNEEKCKLYTFREFESYLYSLYDMVDDYAKKNFIYDKFNIADDNIFTDKSYCLKIKNKFYAIELVVGQGSFVRFELVADNNSVSYVDYDLMVINEKSPHYENNLKETVNIILDGIVEELVKNGANKEMIKKFIQEY
ncbi:MAG: hypothetical protein ACLTDM_18880 [Clostridium butyricum]